MAGKVPNFITGANAILRVNDFTIAYCTNVSYTISVAHASPILLGMYESSSIEPLSYKVSGSFSIIRFVADSVSQPNSVFKSAGDGNGIGNWKNSGSSIGASNGRAYDSLNPDKLDKAATFDLEIMQKTKTPGHTTSHLAKIRNCRITQSSLQLGVRSAANQAFNFIAIYADEDSFLANSSGSGQQYA